MKKNSQDKKKTSVEPAKTAKSSNLHIVKLIVFLICVLIFVSLYSYSSQDPLITSFFNNNIELDNNIGIIGAFVSGWLVYFFGIYAYLVPLFILSLTFNILFKYLITSFRKFVGVLLLVFVFFALSTYYEWKILDIVGGGFVGAYLYQHALMLLNPLGSLIFFYSLLPLAIECFFPRIIAKTLHVFYLCYALTLGKLFTKVQEKKQAKKELLALEEHKEKDFDDAYIYDAEYDDDYDDAYADDFDDTYDDKNFDKKNKFDKDRDSNRYDDDLDDFDDSLEYDDYKDNHYEDNDEYDSIQKEGVKKSTFSKMFGFLNKKKKDDTFSEQAFELPEKESAEKFRKKRNVIDPFERPYDDDDDFDGNFDNNFDEEAITDLSEEYITKSSAPSQASRAARTKLYASPRPRKRKPIPKNLHLPTPKLLSTTQTTEVKVNQKEIDAKGALLIRVLQEFNIQAILVRITTGPVVTMFEVRPAAGTKVSKITSLGTDLAMKLKATSVRFQAPVLGSDTVGVEIPNSNRAIVSFKEMLESKEFKDSPSLISLALGKNISGQPTSVSLAKMPHLLVAGATGTGKSVCLNTILLSILYKAKPHEVKLLLIDPKMVEFAIYDDLPHLVHPVVTNMDEVKYALAWLVTEMERRYNLLSDLGTRNLDSYNKIIEDSKEEIAIKKQQKFTPEELEENPYHEKLPYIVLMIDELADLIMEFGKEVETPIARLGQKARAAGIHMVLATQRPSVNVVTAIIKANMPTRISLSVVSPHDSRTILDTYGAETLLGNGDMLLKAEGGRIQRLHGAFVPDADVAKIVDFWKKQQGPDYKFDFSQMLEEENSLAHDFQNNEKDVLFDKAAEFAPTMRKFSVCGLQRHLNIGFNRASNLRDQLVREGVIHLD